MSSFASRERLLATTIFLGVMAAQIAPAVAQQEAPPDFSSNNAGWLTFHTDFSVVPGATSPMHDDPAHPTSATRRLPEPASNRPISSPISPTIPF